MKYKIIRLLASEYSIWSLVKDYRDFPKDLKNLLLNRERY